MNLSNYTYINGQNRSKNGHSGAIKTNRFQSGFRDTADFFQTEQTVNRKKSGFRAARISGGISLPILTKEAIKTRTVPLRLKYQIK